MTTCRPNIFCKLKDEMKLHFSPTVGGDYIIYLSYLLIYVLTRSCSGKANSLDPDMMVIVVVITMKMIKSY
jgi:hypothetical protein